MTIATSIRQADRGQALLTVKEAAAVMGLTEWWVRRLIASGELRAINVGGSERAARWRIDPEDMRAWLVERQNRPRSMVGV